MTWTECEQELARVARELDRAQRNVCILQARLREARQLIYARIEPNEVIVRWLADVSEALGEEGGTPAPTHERCPSCGAVALPADLSLGKPAGHLICSSTRCDWEGVLQEGEQHEQRV